MHLLSPIVGIALCAFAVACGGSNEPETISLEELRGVFTGSLDGRLVSSGSEEGMHLYEVQLQPNAPNPWVQDGIFRFFVADESKDAAKTTSDFFNQPVANPSTDSADGPDDHGILRLSECTGGVCGSYAMKRYGKNVVMSWFETVEARAVYEQIDARLSRLSG